MRGLCRLFAVAALVFPIFSTVAHASIPVVGGSSLETQSILEADFAGALRGCGEWVLNPASWSEGFAPFISTVGLGDKMGKVSSVAAEALPPPELRQANHYWRINSTVGAGFILIVSDRLPICHITGGGNLDLQPAIEAVLSSDAFGRKWKRMADTPTDDMASTSFQSIEEPKFSMTISRAKQPKQRQDRVQLMVTAIMDIGE